MAKLTRHRVCAAIFRDEHILMVRHRHHGKNYWTLPGGGVEGSETLREAVIREVLEETNLKVEVGRFLFQEFYSMGRNYCFEALANPQEKAWLGTDPEEKEKAVEERVLQELAWREIKEVESDRMVSKVLETLRKTR